MPCRYGYPEAPWKPRSQLAARLEKVRTRLEADAPNMTKPGAALIAHYLDPDRLPRTPMEPR